MRDRVTAEDVRAAVAAAVKVLSGAVDRDWSVPAGGLDWSCWETAEHVADDLFAYAAQLGPAQPSLESYVPFICEPRREGGPRSSIFAEPGAGVPGLLQVVEACGGLLSAIVKVTPENVRSFHSSGNPDPEGFAAMGIVEVLAHTHDIANGLGLAWAPDEALCDRVLRRLFPEAPLTTPRWETFLWSTGRGELPGFDRRVGWRWSGRPLEG